MLAMFVLLVNLLSRVVRPGSWRTALLGRYAILLFPLFPGLLVPGRRARVVHTISLRRLLAGERLLLEDQSCS
jgi:hypothetical protein